MGVAKLRVSLLVLLGALALVAAACGDSDASDPERFCEIDARLSELDPSEAPEDQRAAIAEEMRDLLKEAPRVAPDVIREPVEDAAATNEEILDLLEQADFDFEQVDDAVFAQAIDEFDTAFEPIGLWIDANCG